MAKKNAEEQDAGQVEQQDSGQDAGQAEVQAAFDEASEKGYFGTVPDQAPDESYTLTGQAGGGPAPAEAGGEPQQG